MKGKIILTLFLIALVSYLCGFGASLTLTKKVMTRGSAAGIQYIQQAKPQRSPSPVPSTTELHLLNFSNTIFAGDQFKIEVQTEPGSVCTIRYINPDWRDEELPIPLYQISDPDGRCSWIWTIPPDTGPGKAVVVLYSNQHLQKHTFTVMK